MDLLVGAGAALIALIAVATLVSMLRKRSREVVARKALATTQASGVEPASLHPVIDVDACIGSGSCIDACPELDVIGLIDGKAHVVNPTVCIGHGECLRACPVSAITLVIGSEKRGVDIPILSGDFQSNVPGLYIVGELGGMGLIYNAMTQALQCMRDISRQPPAPMSGVHQVLIVGAGPAGLAASLAAKAAGLSYVTVDQEALGGTVLQYPRHKIVMTRPVKLPLYGELRVTSVSKEDLLATWEQIIAKTGIEVRTGVRVDRVTRDPDGTFTAATSAGVMRAQRVVLAMGRRGTPRKLGVPGEELSKVTYRLLDPERYAGARCLVVGGGDAAVEAAIALGEAGAQTHLSYRGDAFSRIKPKNRERLDAAVAGGKVVLLLSSEVKRIEPSAVSLEQEKRAVDLPNDYVLVFAGGVLPQQFLDAAGIRVRTFQGEAFAPANA